MVFERLLPTEKLKYWHYFIVFGVLFIIGCKVSMVNYEDFLEKPSAKRVGEFIEVNLGYTPASANWIKAEIDIQGDQILISGKLTFKEIPQSISIKLPDSNMSYRVFWVDRDGKKTEITVKKQ
jgi:hypothetical protein